MFKIKLMVASMTLVLLLGFVANGGSVFAAEGDKGSKKPIVVGVFFASVGDLAVSGLPGERGARLAVKEISASGGIKGTPVEFIFEDTQSKKEQVVSIVQKFVARDKVVSIIGSSTSGEAFTGAPIANENKTPILIPFATAAGINHKIGPFVFRNSLPDSEIIPVVVRKVNAKLKLQRVAIIYDNADQYGQDVYKHYKGALENNKIPIVDTETFARGDVNYSAQLTKIKAANPDALVVAALPEEGANILFQARDMGMTDIPVLAGNAFNTAKLFKIAGKAVAGCINGTAWLRDFSSKRNLEFVKNFKQTYNTDPDQFAAQSYDAVFIMADALKRAKNPYERDSVRQALQEAKDFQGVTNKLSFKADGDAEQEGIVVILNDQGQQLEYK
jgi:branched-chain amino acid transport system substrate-binding protein